jgi:hypothetical protein
VAAGCLLTVQWAEGQACTVTIATTPTTPVLVGQSVTAQASVDSGVGQLELDGAVVCSNLPCSAPLGALPEGIHTLSWFCTTSGGNNHGSQILAVGHAFKQFLPKYQIFSLVYAPPGNQSQNGFTDSITTGVSSGVTQSFQQGTSLSFSLDGTGRSGNSLFGINGGGSVGGTTTDSHGELFTELITSASGTAVPSAVDPVNHYQDRFYLWLNPMVTVFQTGDNEGVFVVNLPQDSSGNILPPGVVDVSVAELMNPAQIPLRKLQPSTINGATIPGLASLCAQPVACTLTNACGCVPSDFAEIVQQDPLVFDPNNPGADPNQQPPRIDIERYFFKQVESLTGPDCAPPACTGPRNTFSVTDATTISNTSTTTSAYNVGSSVGLSFGVGPFTLRLTGTDSWTWSDAVLQGNSAGHSTLATVTFATSTPQCAENYNVYEDVRFHTFTFAPADDPPPPCLSPVPDFNLVAFPPTAGGTPPPAVINGGSATYLVSSLGMLGFTGTETLSVAGMPAGMSATFSPSSFNLSPTSPAGTSILTVSTTDNVTPPAVYPLTVVGTGGGLTHSAPITISVQDFGLTVTPNSPNVTTNGTVTYTVTVTPIDGFHSTVALTTGTLPAGVTALFSPTSITGSGTATLTLTTSGAFAGSSSFAVIGTVGTGMQTATATLNVVDFSIAASPSSQTLAEGGTTTYTVTATSLNSFGDAITLSVSALPNGVTGSFNPVTLAGSGTSILTLSATPTASIGPAPLTISGTGRGITHSSGVTLVVNPPPAISSVSPTQAPVNGVITIGGSNFNAAQRANTLTIGGQVATVTSWSDGTIVAVVPAGLSLGNAAVVVTVDGSRSNSVNLSVTPGITGISPGVGPVGTQITIAGTNFGASQGTSSVSIGGASATVTGWSDTSVVASVPVSLPLGNAAVVVTVNALSSNGLNFAVTPGITTLSPSSGPVGTSVTMTGTNFGTSQGISTVTFAGTVATPTSWSNTSIVVPAPGLIAGSVSVVVTVNGATSNPATYTFTPGVASVAPASGPVGASVTITGSDFGAVQGSSTVTFGGLSVTPSSWSDNSISVNVPSSLGVGNVPLVVTVNGVSGNGNFTVTPGITSLTPSSGPVGSSLTIVGTNFGSTQGTSSVTIGGLVATTTSWNAGSIAVAVPNGLATGNASVVVTVGGFSSPSVNFGVKPGITSLTPASGPVGTSITIAGTSFGATQGASTVSVGGVVATPTSWSSGSIAVPVPPTLGLGAAPVIVTVGGSSSASVNFNITPGIASLSPSTGGVGIAVTITGTNFGATQGTSTLTVGGSSVTPTNWSNTGIGFNVPANLGLGIAPVIVSVGGVPSNTVNFTVAPAITSLTPPSGPVGSSVTIAGSNFGSSQGTSTVSFGGVAVTPSNWTNSSLSVLVPSLAPGSTVVSVTVNGLISNNAIFVVTPVITNLSLISGPAGTAITITGTNFGSSQGPSTVTVAGITAAPANWSSTSIAVNVPAGLGPGSSPVVVTVNGAASNTSFFTVTPSITSLSPASGVVGTTVTIAGSGFGASQGSSTITFNGVAATVSSWANTTIVAKAPSTATTGNVVVTVNSIPSNAVTFTVTSPTVYFPVSAASTTSGLLQLRTTSDTSPTNLLSADLVNQPSGEYLIQAFDTQAGVPNSSAVWQSGMSTTITVYMNQTVGTTSSLFPRVKLFLNSASGTPICTTTGSSAITTTQTLYTLSCSPAADVALTPSDRIYAWVGVNSSATSASSEKAQLTIGPPSRGKQAGNISVPIH